MARAGLLVALCMVLLVACQSPGGVPPEVEGPGLPGLYASSAEPGETRHLLELRRDRLFVLRRVSTTPDGGIRQVNDAMGRWLSSSDPELLVLAGSMPERLYLWLGDDDTLILADRVDGVETRRGVSLRRVPTGDRLDAELLLRAAYVPGEDRLRECLTGQSLRPVSDRDAARLRQAHREEGGEEPVIVTVTGRLQPPAAGRNDATTGLLLGELVEVLPGETCPPPLEALALRGTLWRVTELRGGGVPAGLPGRPLTLRFDDGMVRGFAGCNRFLADVEHDDRTIAFGEIRTTQHRCPDAVPVERALLQSLQESRHWLLLGDRLELRDDAGRVLVRFEGHPGGTGTVYHEALRDGDRDNATPNAF